MWVETYHPFFGLAPKHSTHITMSMTTTGETIMARSARLMDIILCNPDGTYSRSLHSFESPAQVDSMRDMLMAQNCPATWVVLHIEPGQLGAYTHLYSGCKDWETHHIVESRQSGV